MLSLIHLSLDLFARGGGGGSSGGGGGGGGGGGLIALFFIGYAPMGKLGSIFRKKEQVLFGSLLLWPLSLVLFVALTWVLDGYGFIIGIGALAGAGSGLYGWFNKILKMSKKAKQDMAAAAALDPAWDEATVLQKTSQIFYDFQQDWSVGNTEKIKSYTTPTYHYHVSLMISALQFARRANKMVDTKIISQYVTNVHDGVGVDGDTVTIGFQAASKDTLIDIPRNEVLFVDTNIFIEYWTFIRSGNDWLLDHIDQSTADAAMVSSTLQAYALSKQYCFSPDWGWLLLPRRGQLFGKGKFGVSDINNHIIGVYENSLVQVYTYEPNPSDAESTGKSYYLIAQAYTDKSYGNILVRRKKFLGSVFSAPKGLQKIETEWTKFNQKYEVYASSAEGVASFELLEPTYMEKLEALPFEVNIEVVDNVAYLYSKEKKMNPEHYPAMMDILHEAYKHMKR